MSDLNNIDIYPQPEGLGNSNPNFDPQLTAYQEQQFAQALQNRSMLLKKHVDANNITPEDANTYLTDFTHHYLSKYSTNYPQMDAYTNSQLTKNQQQNLANRLALAKSQNLSDDRISSLKMNYLGRVRQDPTFEDTPPAPNPLNVQPLAQSAGEAIVNAASKPNNWSTLDQALFPRSHQMDDP